MDNKTRKTIRIVLILSIIVLALILAVLMNSCNQEPVKECKDYPYAECPASCVVCPPCEVCSSISCQTEEFCEDIGFNRGWYEDMKTRIIG